MYVSAIELLVRKFERVLAITRFLCRNIKFVLLQITLTNTRIKGIV